MDMFCMKVYVVCACVCQMNLCCFVYLSVKMLYCSHFCMAAGKISCKLTGSPFLNKVFELNWILILFFQNFLFKIKSLKLGKFRENIWYIITSMALISIRVSLKGIFSGNFSLTMATSKQSPKSICIIFPFVRSNIRLDGCLQTENIRSWFIGR